MAADRDFYLIRLYPLQDRILAQLGSMFQVPTVSLHVPGAHKRAAVKIVDDRGIESLRSVPLP